MKHALFIGLTEEQFYNLSLAEYSRLVEAYKEQQERVKRRDYSNMVLLSSFTIGRLSSNYKVPSFDEIYHTDKKDDKLSNDEASEANFMRFAQANNLKRGGI